MHMLTNNNPMIVQGEQRKRESNLELFRIITMLLIIAHHYVVNSGLIFPEGPIYSNPMSANSLFLSLFGAWGKIGINCFVMITGYFMCKSDITARKFAKLVCEYMFYNVLFYLIFLLLGYESFSLRSFIKMIIPITQVRTNFVSCFLIFYLYIPFLNILLRYLDERKHIWLLLLSAFLYVVFGTVHQVTMNYVSWFIVLYFIASYFRLYPKKCFDNTKRWGMLMILSIVLSAISVVVCSWTGVKIHTDKILAFAFVTDSNTFLAVVVGVCAFMFFKNLKIGYNGFINTIAVTTFGVFLIHTNSDTMRKWLWKDILDVVGHYNSALMPLHAIGSVVGIFIVCVLIDIMRIKFIEKPFFKWWDKHWENFRILFHKKEEKVFRRLNVE